MIANIDGARDEGARVAREGADAFDALASMRFGALTSCGRSPGRILADADDLARDGLHVEARRERRLAAAALWQHLCHADQRPPGVSRQQARRWIASVTA